MNFYKKIAITIFSILVVFGVSAGLSSAFIGPDPGQSPGTGGGLFNVGSDRTIKYGTGETTPSTGPASWGHVFTVASTSIPGLGLENLSANGGYFWFADENNRLGLWDEFNSRFNLYVNSSGNIGIGNGNDTATSTLTIFDTGKTNELYVAGGAKATSFTGSGINLTNIDPQNFIAGSAFNAGNYAVNGSFAIGTSTVTGLPSNGLYVDGNVGIGISSPNRKLDVIGIIRAGNTGGTGGTGRFEAIGGSSGEAVLTLGDSSNPNAGVIRYRNSDNSIAFDTNDSEKLRITSGGNVGIGTTTPSGLLELASDGSINSRLQGGGTNYVRHFFQAGTASEAGFRWNVGLRGDISNKFSFEADTTGNGAWNHHLTIEPGGNVGIGTTTPPSKLTVNGTIETLSGGVKFPDGTIQTTAGGGGGGDAVGWDRDDNNGYVYLATSTDSVGIGDSTPSAKLDVNGGIYGSILYDKDNDSYYMNPSGTSNVSQVDVNSALNVLGNSYYKGGSNTNLYIRQATSSSNGLIWWEDEQNDSNWYIGSTETNSTWKLSRYNSSGSFVDTPFYVDFGNGQVNLNNTIDANSNKIISLATPTSGSDAATKSYVDSTAGGGVPSGSDGQTLRNSGGSWVATDNLYNDGSSIGIGTTTPNSKLHISHSGGGDGTWDQGILVENTGSTSGEPAVSFKNSSTGSNYWITGINQTNSYDIAYGSSFVDGNILFSVGSDGQVGVGIADAAAKLDVDGSIHASTYYDQDNTSYYVNPSGNTNLNGDVDVNNNDFIISTGDGLQMGRDNNVCPSNDCYYIMKTDGNSSDPDGDFTIGNRGSDNVFEPAITVMGSNNVGIGLATSTGAGYPLDVDGNIRAATLYDQNNTSYYMNPSSASNINSLTVNGNWTLSGAAQADVNMNNNDLVGVNKITVGTIDPLYKINGQKYATYVPDTIGLKTEIYGKADLQKEFTGKEYPKFSHTIDFDQVEEGSDLWLFWKTISLADDMSDMIVSLTPEGSNADIWYELDSNENQLVIRSDKLATVSYHLVAPRHDSDEWPTKTDTEEEPSFIFEEGEWIK